MDSFACLVSAEFSPCGAELSAVKSSCAGALEEKSLVRPCALLCLDDHHVAIERSSKLAGDEEWSQAGRSSRLLRATDRSTSTYLGRISFRIVNISIQHACYASSSLLESVCCISVLFD
jgi:hypothetical protein